MIKGNDRASILSGRRDLVKKVKALHAFGLTNNDPRIWNLSSIKHFLFVLIFECQSNLRAIVFPRNKKITSDISAWYLSRRGNRVKFYFAISLDAFYIYIIRLVIFCKKLRVDSFFHSNIDERLFFNLLQSSKRWWFDLWRINFVIISKKRNVLLHHCGFLIFKKLIFCFFRIFFINKP